MKLGFNPREYANRDKKSSKPKYKPAPEGFYDLECIEITLAVSGAGNKMLKVVFEILDPPTADIGYVREYFVREPAGSNGVEVANQRLADWAIAAGKPDVQDTHELEHSQVRAKLRIEPAKGDYDACNKVKSFVAPRDKPKSAKAAAKARLGDEPEQPAKDELEDEIPF